MSATARPWLVANLIAQLAFGLLAMTICLPSMQEWGRLLGVTQTQVQLTFSVYVLAFGVMQLVHGPLSDRFGRRRVLLSGLVLTLAGSLLAASAQGIETLVIGRLLQGAGCAAGMVVCRALVQDLFVGPHRTRVMAYIGMAMGLCPPIATVLGGQIHVRWGWRVNFALVAVLAVGLMVAAWRGLPGRAASAPLAPPEQGLLVTMARSYARLAREPAFLRSVAILGMTTGCFYVFLGGAPLVLGGLGVGPDGIGFYVMAIPLAYIVGNFTTSRWAPRFGEPALLRLGQASTVSGVVLMLVLNALGQSSPLAFALPLTLVGLGHGLLVPPVLAASVGLLPALAGAAAAVAGLAQQVTGALGGYLVGWLPSVTPGPVGWLMLAFTGTGLLIQSLLPATRSTQA